MKATKQRSLIEEKEVLVNETYIKGLGYYLKVPSEEAFLSNKCLRR